MTPTAAARLDPRVPAVSGRFCAMVAVAAVATLLLALLTVPTAAAAPRAPRAEPGSRSPLAVSIGTLTPSTVPQRGRITVTGEVANRSKSTWTDLKVYLVTSTSPMTTQEELAEATGTDAQLEVGPRLTSPGLYDEIDDLAPGESTSYRLSVPRSALPVDQPGVYWLGVHVLGSNEEGRVDGADGRARTFIANMPSGSPRTALALALPLRAQVTRTSTGQVGQVKAWNRRLGEDGRLTRLVELASTSFDQPVTWVVDPAVLEAARSLSEGNPGFDLASTRETGQRARGSGDAADESPTDESPAEEGTDEPDPAEAEQAAEWLSDFTDLAGEQTVMTLPYGDVDVARLLRGDFRRTFERANDLSALVMVQLDIDATPVVAPLDGLFPAAALESLPLETTMLLSRRSVDTDAAEVLLPSGHEVLLGSDIAKIGGPSPAPRFTALALRQRILAEAAAHALGDSPGDPLVVPVPNTWDPGRNWRSASFFSGLDVPWLRLVDLPFAQAVDDSSPYDGPLRYPRAVRKREVPVANVLTTQELNTAGDILGELLTRNDAVDDEIGRAAMLGSSTHARRRPHQALVRTRQISTEVHDRLERVYVEGSPLVTMSSETGNFSVTVVNGLEEPVTVGIDVETGSEDLEIRAPDLVSLGPGQRASVRLAVTSTGTGVHSVRIVPTTQEGRPLGSSTKVKVRSSQVGLVIWLIIGTGGVLFVAAIIARIRRRIRDRRSEDQTETEDVTL